MWTKGRRIRMRKRVVLIILAIVGVLFFTTSCSKESYPKNINERYDNPLDVISDISGAKNVEYLFELEYENFVILGNRKNNAFSANFLYKDELGYYPSDAIDFNVKTKMSSFEDPSNSPGGVTIIHANFAGKEIIWVTNATKNLDFNLCISDSQNTKIQYESFISDDDLKFSVAFWVLDEIPNDYSLIINGEENNLPKFSIMIIWYFIFAIVIFLIIILIVKRTKQANYLKKTNLQEDIFK